MATLARDWNRDRKAPVDAAMATVRKAARYPMNFQKQILLRKMAGLLIKRPSWKRPGTSATGSITKVERKRRNRIKKMANKARQRNR